MDIKKLIFDVAARFEKAQAPMPKTAAAAIKAAEAAKEAAKTPIRR